MLETLKSLSDPTRLRLLGLLARGEFTVQELTEMLGMGQSRISRHLKILADAGIVSVKRQGTWGYYRQSDQNDCFREVWPALESRLEEIAERRSDLDALARVFEERRLRSREFFERHARQWDRLSAEILPSAPYLERLLEAVPPCESLLEVGVGTGALLPQLLRLAKRVVGVDHSPAMLQEARGRCADADLRLGEMSHLPLSDAEVETVVLNMVFHHAEEPARVLGEIARVLTPGGTLVIADLARHEKEWARERMADQWLGFDREELSGWLAGGGFEVETFSEVKGRGDELDVFILKARKRSGGGITA
jgi:DNA-binding transcriptional ArsR family regulator